MILALRGGLWRGGWRRSVAVGLVLLLGAGVLPVLAASVSVLPAAADPVPDASLCSGQAYSKWLDTVDARVRFFVPKGRTIDMSLTTWGVAGGYTASYAATVESSGSTVTLANTVSGHQDAHTGAPEDGVSLGTVASAPYDRVFTVSLSYAGRSITAWQFVWQITQGASFGCDPQAPNANSAALHDDPVDVASGNLLGHEVDLSVPAGASRLAVVDRYLNNFDGSMRSLGPKWKFGFDGRLVKVIDGVWELREASGAVWQFREDGSGGWTSPSEYLARLTYDAGSARYVVSRPDRTKDWFNAAGNLVQQTDASGSVVSISRSSGGAITSIASGTYSVAFEDTLALNSAGVPVAGSDGYVDRAVSSDGRVVRYGYNKDVVKGSTVLGSVSEPHSPAADAAST